MTKSELRAMRLRIIDGRSISNETALQIVSALEDVAGVVEKACAPRSAPFMYEDLPAVLRGLRDVLRAAGPLEDR